MKLLLRFSLQIRHEVSFKAVTHKICSDSCFNVYRRANGLIMNCCEQCGDYLPSRASANHFLLVDGQQKRFCCQACITEYKQVLRSRAPFIHVPLNDRLLLVVITPWRALLSASSSSSSSYSSSSSSSFSTNPNRKLPFTGSKHIYTCLHMFKHVYTCIHVFTHV